MPFSGPEYLIPSVIPSRAFFPSGRVPLNIRDGSFPTSLDSGGPLRPWTPEMDTETHEI